MIYKKFKSGAFNVHTIKTDKFRNCQIEVMFRDKINKEDITKRIMLCDILCESSNEYKDSKSFHKQKELLYNTLFYSTTTRVGQLVYSNFIINFIDPKYADNNFLEKIIELLCNTIQKPNIKDEKFDKKSFEKVFKQIEDNVLIDKENPSKYSVYQMIKNMDKESPACIKINGYLKDLKKINPKNLYEYYQEFISHNYCDIFIIGNLDMEKVVKLINNFFNIKTIKNHKLDMSYIPKKRLIPKKLIEKTKFNQSILVVGCNLQELTKKEKDVTMFLYNAILGSGSIDSKLGDNLRQQNSLCYNVGSFYQKYDNILIIRTAFNESNYNLAVKLIKKSLTDMKKGDITDDEFNNAKLAIIQGLTLAKDDQSQLLSNYIMNQVDKIPLLDDRIEIFKSIRKEEVIEVARKVKLNTIYLLSVGGE